MIDAAIPPEMAGPEINVGELMGAGWVYRDPEATFDQHLWDKYLGLIGAGNFHIVGMVVNTNERGEKLYQGQFLISPAGMANLQAYIDGARH